MSMPATTMHSARLLLVGTTLALSVSLATAAIVMWIPASPDDGVAPATQQVALNMDEYVYLHHARNGAVPGYRAVDVEGNQR